MRLSTEALIGCLQDAGLTVITKFLTEGESDGGFDPIGLILHHDAGGLGQRTTGVDESIPQNMAQRGNNGAQFWVPRNLERTVYLLSSGRKWHAGTGNGYDLIPANSGNSRAYGIETDYGPTTANDIVPAAYFGVDGFDWPEWSAEMKITIDILSGALVHGAQLDFNSCCGHKEYAPDRKIDPANFDLDGWRTAIQTWGGNPTPQPPPEEDMSTADEIADAVIKKLGFDADGSITIADVREENGKLVEKTAKRNAAQAIQEIAGNVARLRVAGPGR